MAFYAKRETISANREMRGGEKNFFLLLRLALRAKCRVRLAWLIKRLLWRHRQVFIVFNYYFSAFLLQKFSV